MIVCGILPAVARLGDFCCSPLPDLFSLPSSTSTFLLTRLFSQRPYPPSLACLSISLRRKPALVSRIMDQRMALQLVGAAKSAPTPGVGARKRPLARVRADMFREVASLDEPLATVGAHERSVAIVRALVDCET